VSIATDILMALGEMPGEPHTVVELSALTRRSRPRVATWAWNLYKRGLLASRNPGSGVQATYWINPGEDLVEARRHYAHLMGEQACRVCGCCDSWGCEDGCWWVEPGLCSSCAERAVPIEAQL
jgi:hypothetical protein